jgi:hypothetical protein
MVGGRHDGGVAAGWGGGRGDGGGGCEEDEGDR